MAADFFSVDYGWLNSPEEAARFLFEARGKKKPEKVALLMSIVQKYYPEDNVTTRPR